MIFAFGGSALMATSLLVVQRTCNVRLISDKLAEFVFWGWQAVIVLAVIMLPLGITRCKEYTELEWPITILIAVVIRLRFFWTRIWGKTTCSEKELEDVEGIEGCRERAWLAGRSARMIRSSVSFTKPTGA